MWGTFKDTASERRLFRSRAVISMAVVLVMTSIVVGRFYYLQLVQHQTYTTLSDKNRVQVQSIPPTRGLIYDRNGELLAQNRPVFSVTIVPERVESIDGVLGRLDQLIGIPESDAERFRKRVKEYRRPFEPIPLRYNLTEDEIARLAVHRHTLPGVEVDAELVRYYPHAELTAHALGYVGRINEQELRNVDPVDYAGTNYIGKLGVEDVYEDILHGTVGYQNVETNARGRVLRVLEKLNPVPGDDLRLHLDIRLQALAMQLLEGRRGAIVAIEPKTGGILALASAPSFDTNSFVTGIDSKSYRELRESRDLPLFNRALRGQYPPGSTIKPMMAIAGLDSDTVTQQKTIWDPGFYRLSGNDRVYRDWKRSGHGWMNLRESISQSCDTYFYDMGYKMGVDTMSDYLARFSFGMNATLDVGGALSGLLPTREWKRGRHNLPWFPGDSVNMSIGQGFLLTTPLQLATATAMVANRGEWAAPRMLRMLNKDTDAATVLPESPLADLDIQRPEDWEYVIAGMKDVMHGPRGTARAAGKGAPFEIAGKSGTAQVFSLAKDQEYDAEELAERLRDHALFVAFAPADNPQIAVAVMVENGGSGSGVAAPMAREMLNAWITGFSEAPPGGEPGGDAIAQLEAH
ncbi:MAG: penicillin-binding protein 2 [Alteromonadaceae bacterium]|nr:penicillin-binding protein 2 [Alteromonadaceae bacterium]